MRYARSARSQAAVVVFVFLLAATGCSRKEDNPAIEAPQGQTTAPTVTSSTVLSISKESLVLAPDGFGVLRFGEPSASLVSRLTQALGAPDKDSAIAPEKRCGASRALVWSNLQVLVNDAPGGRTGFVGWFYGVNSPKPSLFLKTDKGVGLGSTVATLNAAYGDQVDVEHGEQGFAFSVTDPKGILLGQLTSMADNGMVTSIQAGSFCGV